MPKEKEKTNAEFKAGIFIIATVSILVFCILWLKFFTLEPSMTIIAKFSQSDPLSKGTQAYYRGVNIGNISKVEFSGDYKYTLVYINIIKKDFKIPSNVYAEVKTQGITGQPYIDLVNSKYPSSKILVDNEIIKGKSPFQISDIQNFFEAQIKSGRLNRIFEKTEATLNVAYSTSKKLDNMSKNADDILTSNKKDINTFLKNSSKAALNLNQVMQNISSLISDPQINKDIKSTISASSGAAISLNQLLSDKELQTNFKETTKNIHQISSNINAITADTETQSNIKSVFTGIGRLFGSQNKNGIVSGEAANTNNNSFNDLGSLISNLDKLIVNLNCYSGKIYKNIKDANLIDNMSNTFSKASLTLDKTNTIIDKTGDTKEGQTMLTAITSAANSHAQAMKRFNCVNASLSNMLSQRFLLIKLLFGKPGSSFENCENQDNCPKK